MGLSRQGYWSGFPCTPTEDILDPGIQLESLALQVDSLLLSHGRSPVYWASGGKYNEGVLRTALVIKGLSFRNHSLIWTLHIDIDIDIDIDNPKWKFL